MASGLLRLAVLISGRGSNMQALAQACHGRDCGAEIAVIISNRPDAGGIEWAGAQGLATEIVDHKTFAAKADFESRLLDILHHYRTDLVCLAGFMRLLSEDFVENWRNRMINIHPSLLPEYKGLNVHERVLADGCCESGCTVHFVRPEMDTGPIIIQRRVPVLPDDDPGRLANRILEQEHIAYPEAVRLISQGKIKIVDEQVEFI